MKIRHIFTLLAASAMLTSCGFLDEYNPNSVTAGNYYTSEDDIVASLNGVYTSLTQSYVANNYHYFTDVRANTTVVTSSGANSGIPYQFYNYTLTPENVYVYNRYTQLYKIISRANTLFAHLDDVSYASPAARDTYEAEARFLRALAYYWLVTEWGDVPLVLKELESTEEVRANNYRRPKAEIYQAIFDDLKYVTESPLSDVQPASGMRQGQQSRGMGPLGKGPVAAGLRRGLRRFETGIAPRGDREAVRRLGLAQVRRTCVGSLLDNLGPVDAEVLCRKYFPGQLSARKRRPGIGVELSLRARRMRVSPRRRRANCKTLRRGAFTIRSSRAISAAHSCVRRTRRGRPTTTP